MINERHEPIWRPIWESAVSARAWQLGGKVSMDGTTFFIAVGGVSLILFWLMVRADRIRERRRAYADSIASNTSSISSFRSAQLVQWQHIFVAQRFLCLALFIIRRQ